MAHILTFLVGDYLKSNMFLIVCYMVLNLVLYPINSIYMPQLYSELISKVSNPTKQAPHLTKFHFLNKMNHYKNQNITNLIYFITATAILVGCLFRLKSLLYSIIFPKYKMWLRNKLFQKTLEKRNTDFEEQKVGKEIMRIEDIIFTTKEIFNFLIQDCTELTLISIIIIIYLYTLDNHIAFYVFLQLVAIGILIYISYHKIQDTTLIRINAYYNIADNIDNSYTNLSNVIINNQIKKEINKNKKHSKSYKDETFKSSNVLNNLSLITRIITIIAFTAILIQGYQLTQKKQLTVTNFTTIIIILLHFQGYLYGQAWNISSTIDRIVQIQYSKDYLLDLLKPNNKNKNLTDVITNGKIEFKNIHFQYKKTNQPVIQNLNLQIQPNEKLAILGKSGSGKSTLVKLLICFYKLDKGTILIDNVPVQDINIKYLRNQVNYVNQNTLLFDEDIYYNIKYGNKTDTEYNFITPSPSNQLNENNNNENENENENEKEQQMNQKIDKILKKYDLLTIYDNLESGLKTNAGPKGTKLSMGMQKVTILLRGLMRNSKIIIFDEPLAGLDSKSREKVIKMIVEETKNKTVIIITHDQEIIPYMNRTVNLKDLNQSKPHTKP